MKRVRDEGVRIAPELFVPVQQPRRDQHDVVLLHRHAGDGIRPGRRARDQERRRIKPHGLVDHRAGEFQPLDIERAVDGRGLHLGRQLLLGRRDRAPADRATRTARSRWSRGRRESWSRPRSPSCSSVKACAGLGIARGAHQVEQIARRRALVLAGGAALGHQHADECGPALAEAGAGKILRARPAQRQQQVEEMRPRQPLAILHDEVAQAPRRGDPSRTKTSCGRRSRASSAASPRADRPARCWRP